MEHKILVVALTLVGALTLFGCGDDSQGTGGTGGSSDTVTIDFKVIAFEPAEDDVDVPGAEVCVADTTNCGTTDAEGLVVLTLPANAEIALTVIAEGFTKTLAPQTTTDVDLTNIQTAVLTDEIANLLAMVLDTPYPLGNLGAVALSTLTAPVTDDDNGIPGVTYTLNQEKTAYYLAENGFPTFDLMATTAPDGAGGYVELSPGEYEITLGGTASNCVVVSGWPGSDANSIRFPVRADFFTQAFVTCDPVAATP
jgi:hypothetical protein